mmetsp:Transcript_22708/g.56117  ORF Transcript_22708/g.56117 Transcript_22708/m.56117 type:complete len:225 (+) Transcript_22708:441-1115(+)|eukprot:CAMPEP_0113647452 /NCGR_PEP_ID=MMETSP0017_2-20120614/25115_1 /TAXON_ID=2856 /ORGANISM="Cylindrotheca closterium" /LENGTH=224 /DNA_ID=CAMNT_0000559503 /DNA_START=344 /DNA_END=1018 /DNA_ORIENTATION=+ /assembly_acc=CAM_ASM_000147
MTKKSMNMPEDSSNQESRVTMNVGGTMFTVNADTIMQYPDTMLGSMLSKRWTNEHETDKELFLDRDPVLFRYILGFYRNARLVIPHTITKTEMLGEIEYFSLPLGRKDIQFDTDSIAGMRNAVLDFERRYVAKLKETARKGKIAALANELAADLIDMFRERPKDESVCFDSYDIGNRDVSQNIVEDKFFQETIKSAVERAGYTFIGEITRGSMELGRSPSEEVN